MKFVSLLRICMLCAVFSAECSCGVIFRSSVKERKLYVLSSQPCQRAVAAPLSSPNIFISDANSAAFINSLHILFSRSPETRGAYQLAAWTEPPPKRLAAILVERIECANLFHSVLRHSVYADVDLQLNTELIDFYHDISSKPGHVTVSLRAELLDLKKREVIASRLFTKEQSVMSFDVDGAVLAFSQASAALTDEIVVWLKEASSLVVRAKQG